MPKVLRATAAGAGLLAASCVKPDTNPAITMFHPAVPEAPATMPQPPAPSKDAVWVPARYEWDSAALTYTLQPGQWSQNVPAAQVWQPGHWIIGPGDKYIWVAGHWTGM